jgi:DNA-binding IclR family transcriptional regulator
VARSRTSDAVDSSSPPGDEKQTVGTVSRVIRLLQLVAEMGSFSLKDMAQRLQLPPSTTHRLLQLLVQSDIIERTEHQTYKVGREYYRLGSLAAKQFDLNAAARSYLVEIGAEFGETCSFALYLPVERKGIIVDTVRTLHPLRHHIDEFVPWPLVWGALGRTMLAYLPDDVVAAVLAASDPSPALSQPPPTKESLVAEFAGIRALGYYVSINQNVMGATGTAAPVFAAAGRLVGSLGITVPIARYKPEMQPALSASIVRHARALSSALGYRDEVTVPMPSDEVRSSPVKRRASGRRGEGGLQAA